MKDRFHGIGRLLGAQNLQKLHQARIMVVGLGGVGSWVAESLARTGVGHLLLVDLDDICVSNINRQIHALNSTVGKLKVDVMQDRIREINPQLEVTLEHSFLSEKNISHLLDWRPHVLIDCTDDVQNKCLMASVARTQGLRLITVGASGGRTDPTLIEVSDLTKTSNDKLLFRVRKKLRREFGFPREGKGKFGIRAIHTSERAVFTTTDGCLTHEPRDVREGLDCAGGYGSASFVTGTFGFFAAAEAVKWYLAEAP